MLLLPNTRILLAGAACVFTQQLFAQPFHGWRGAYRDGIYSETNLLKSWPDGGPQLLWEADDAGKGYSSPVVVGDKLYITGLNENGDKEVFSAYTLEGKRLYQVEYGLPWAASYSENRSTPTVVGDKAYVVSGMSEVVCLSVADGKILWKVDGAEKFSKKEGRWGTAESPLVFDGKVIYSPCGEKTTMVALNAATGEVAWESKPLGSAAAYVSPQLVHYKGKKQIVGVTSQCAYGVNPENGNILWQFDEFPLNKKEDYKICVNTPLFKDGKIYVSNGYNLGSFLLQLSDDLSSVELLWRNEDLDTHTGGFVLVNGTIYGSSWINNNKGNWVAVDWNTGVTKYDADWGNGKSKGSIISADNMLYCYDERRGVIGLVNATPEKFDVVSEFRVTKGEGPHWAHPVIHGGVLFARHGSALMAYKIR
ncbi:MAG: PQQ-like beta-propeller repeat protein [Prevotellaceae bacterium]|nr:PQQ-like beta-propeller repeat protein [Prevotellaceae bacterium]